MNGEGSGVQIVIKGPCRAGFDGTRDLLNLFDDEQLQSGKGLEQLASI